jgi:hypothetical protein
MAHVDHGAVSRRALLTGGAASVVLLAGLGIGADYEIDRHPALHRRLFGCGHTPPIPGSSYRVTTATMRSAAMKGDMPWTVAVPADHSPSCTSWPATSNPRDHDVSHPPERDHDVSE